MKEHKPFLKIIFKTSLWVIITLVAFVLIANIWVVGSTHKQIYVKAKTESLAKTVLVLGTSYNTVEGKKNHFFYERMSATASVYKLNHVQQIILSGSKTKYYNESQAMRKSLAEFGVPDSILVTDNGGVRTLDSVLRCKNLFAEDKIIIITQRFHAYRALFISNYYNMDAIVVVAQSQKGEKLSVGVLIREVLARPLAVLDLYVFHSKPQFDTININ